MGTKKSSKKTSNALLSEEEATGLIAAVTQRTRHHRDIVRGASVRASIALKQVLEGFSVLEGGITRSAIEKAAMITLPPRIETRENGAESAYAVIHEIVGEVLYGERGQAGKPDSKKKKAGKLSLDEFLASLQNLSLSRTLENGESVDGDRESNFQIVADKPGDGGGTGNMERDSRFKDSKNWFPALEKALKEMLGELEQKLIEGEISESDYRYQKKKLEDMLNTASYLESGASGRELAETVFELMEAGDKQWQKELDFQDMYVYYHIKESQGDSGLTLPKRNWYALKVIVDFLEKQEIVSSNEEGTSFSLTRKAIDILLDSLVRKPVGKHGSRTSSRKVSRTGTERRQDSRRYATGDVFRDISVRRTMREIARKRRKITDVNRHDIQVFLKEYREPNSDIILCVDTSGSMGFHRKLILARLAAAALARDALKRGDRVGVVTFDDLGRSVIEPTDREEDVMRYIAGISSGGNTNIGDGIKCAGELLKRERSRNRKSIMLITDGEPTAIGEKALASVGKSEKKDMTGEYAVLESRAAFNNGIETSVVHITDETGAGKRLVENIARSGHGTVRRVVRPDDVRTIMV
jgi:Mg-chelatase subunit ChlD